MSQSTTTKSDVERNEELAPPAEAPGAAAPAEATAARAGVGTPSPTAPAPTHEEALAELRAQLDQEKTARAASDAAQQNAAAEAARLREEVQQGRVSVRDAQLIAISRALDAHEAQSTALRDQYAQALTAADYAKAAELQVSIAETAARKVQLSAAKEQIERMPAPAPADAPHADDFDSALQRYTPRTREWLRKHPEVVRDPKRMQLAVAAHHAALAADHVPDSDAYFDAIERSLGYKQDLAAVTGRRPAPSIAPSRSAAGNGAARALDARDMTPKMLQLAKEADMKPDEWLKNYNQLLADGQIERIH